MASAIFASPPPARSLPDPLVRLDVSLPDRDGLTGLVGRRALLGVLAQHLTRPTLQAAVLFCDLDRFKLVNDSLGHRAGDALLVAVAERLRAAVPPDSVVARLGGDEIVVVLPAVVDEARARRLAEQIARSLHPPFGVGGRELRISASIGVAMAAAHTDAESWLADADAAMYRAKHLGRNRIEVFDAAMRDAARTRLALQHDLWDAVDRDELLVHHQPVVDLATREVVAVEALVRWRSPVHGLLPPDAFVPLAEETGAIGRLGEHVLDRAVADLAAVADATGRDDLRLSVNLSTRQIGPELPGLVAATCRRREWRPDRLVLEVTETDVVDERPETQEVFDQLRALGVVLALDDFGTGHSTLTRLGSMPVGQVKIDRSFVGAIGGADPGVARMVDAVLAVAGALDLDVVAEGIETEEQLAYLRRAGCRRGQGFLFSPALPAEALRDLLRT